MLVKLPIGMIYVMNILTCLRHLGSLLNVKSSINIDLLNPNLPVKHHRQYHMSPTKLEEVHSQLDALLEKGWI